MRIPLGDFRRAIEEQQRLAGGAYVDNVYQCGPRLVSIRLKHDGKSHLRIDLDPGRARALLTDAPPETPKTPPVFGVILRKALRGARLTGVEMPAEDRVVVYTFAIGDDSCRLVVEALPRHGNLLLLDSDGRVKRVLDGEAAKHRGNSVGSPYAAPEPPRIGAPDASLLPDDLPEAPFAANYFLDGLFRSKQDISPAGDGEERRKRSLARLQKTRGAVAGDLRDLPDAARLRAEGELLLCHYAQLSTGMKRFQGVVLDPKLSPQENVERIFERARKADRARPILERRLGELEDWIRRAGQGEPVPERVVAKRKPGAQARRLPYRTFTSADGRRILAGKGGRDNDETTLKVAGPHDLFLHVRGVPGSHVIVPLQRGEQVPEQTLLDAATLALHYSKSRSATSAEVTYTPRKFVSKPKGAKPGLVMVQREKVLRLRREPDRLARLLMTAGAGTDE